MYGKGENMNEQNQEIPEEQSRLELDEETLFLVSQTFKALSDPTRIKILHLLSQGNIRLMKLQKS